MTPIVPRLLFFSFFFVLYFLYSLYLLMCMGPLWANACYKRCFFNGKKEDKLNTFPAARPRRTMPSFRPDTCDVAPLLDAKIFIFANGFRRLISVLVHFSPVRYNHWYHSDAHTATSTSPGAAQRRKYRRKVDDFKRRHSSNWPPASFSFGEHDRHASQFNRRKSKKETSKQTKTTKQTPRNKTKPRIRKKKIWFQK